MTRASSPTLDLDALAAKLAPLVADLLARSLVAGSSPPYSTRAGCGPVGLGHRAWQRVAPTIPGAQHVGRWIVVPRAAYEAWATRSAAPAPSAPANDAPWTPAAALASVGLRASGGR